MPKKKFHPSGDADKQKQWFHRLLLQRPKAYPHEPRSNRNHQIKPIRRA